MKSARRIGVAAFLASLEVWTPSTAPAQGDVAGRPWAIAKGLEDEHKERAAAAGNDPAKRLELARFSLESGLLHHVAGDLGPFANDPEALALLALSASEKLLVPEDLTRLGAAPRALALLPPLPADRRKALLATKDRDAKLKQSTSFDLTTDLESSSVDFHSKMLNDYWRGLRNRFRARLESNVDVIVFAKRSDYLSFYAYLFKKVGEHVLGFYLHKIRVLVYYDDPYARDEIGLVARHECSHLLLDISFGEAPLPPWLHEGMACYLAADGERASGRYTQHLVLEMMSQLGRKGFAAQSLVAIPRGKFEYPNYAQAWSLVHFLNSGERRERFQKFLTDLRERVSSETKDPDCIKIVRESLESAFGEEVDTLGEGCLDYFRGDYRLAEPEQYLDLGFAALERCANGSKTVDAAREIEIAAAALAAARAALPPARLTELRFGELLLAVRRAEIAKVDPLAWKVVLRYVRDGLRELGPLPDESQFATVTRLCLGRIAEAGGVGKAAGKPRDLRAAILAKAATLKEAEAAESKSYCVLAEDFLELAFARLAKALDADPTHRRAAREWMFLALEAAPHKVAEAFPLLTTLVAVDPDDENLAALGLAYIGLGNEKYGKSLLKEAEERSLQPSLLEAFLEWK